MTNIIATINKIITTGQFATSGKIKGILPGLCIKEFGEIAFPLIKEQAEKIIKNCEQAPFGRGEETIIDTSVRNVWQMSPKNVTFTNPEWDHEIAKACKKIAKQLGLSDCKIQFELYKVLIYGPGSFFKRHRDTEKMPNMCATMVVNLPSTHEGGELIVNHVGERKEFSFAGENKFYPEYAAFYADCYHEVKPVKSGYRVSLIYNLAISERKNQPRFSEQLVVYKEIDTYLNQWTNNNNPSPFLVYLLEHSYTEKNLKLSNLKNKDYAKASVLLKSAEKNNYNAFLCLVSYRRESYGECWGGGYYRYGEEVDEGDFEEYDVSQEEIYAHNFLYGKNNRCCIERINLEQEEIIADIPLLEGPGKEVYISEATGNEGATKDLWYHRGAIIMWPKNRSLDVTLRSDMRYAVNYLKKLTQQKKMSEATILANHIMDQNSFFLTENICDSLIAISDYELLNKYLILQTRFGLPDIKMVTDFINSFGFKPFEKEIDHILHKHASNCNFDNILKWLHALILETNNTQEVIPYVGTWMHKRLENYLRACYNSCDSNTLFKLFKIISQLNNTIITKKFIELLGIVPDKNMMPSVFTNAVVDACASYQRNKDDPTVLKKIAEEYIKYVDRNYPLPPKNLETFARKGSINCACSFCKQVNDFLPKPEIHQIIIEKTLKRNLLHIEDNISHYQLDLEIKIEKIGNKFQGTILKNQTSFNHSVDKYKTVTKGKQRVLSMIKNL